MDRLAIDGGRAVCAGQTWKRKLLGDDERRAVVELLDRSIEEGKAFDRYGGTEVDAYEREFAAYLGVQHATAVSSGTAAIHSALGALHLEPGSEVITPPITDTGAVAPIVMQQCIPVFADTAPGSFGISVDGVRKVLSQRTAAVIATHVAGEPIDLDPIIALAREHGVPVIEDVAQAHGAEYHGKLVGSLGDLSAFSLMSGKHHTSGGQGGMVVSNNAALCLDAKRFADRGKPFESEEDSNLFLGLNYRMTDLEATIGRVQLRKLPRMVARRQDLVERLHRGILGLQSVSLPALVPETRSAWWFVRLRVDTQRLTVPKERFHAALSAEGVPSSAAYWGALVYRQKWLRERRTFGESQLPWSLPAFGRTIDYTGCCPNAEQVLEDFMLVMINESYSNQTIDLIVQALTKVENAYLK